MKVQFSTDALRIRLPRDAFDALRAGEALRLDLPVSVPAPAILVCRGPAFAARVEDGALRITWPAEALDGLAARLPARDGLEADGALAGRPVRVVLEVDVRAGRRASPPGSTR